jgi:hypothetical protein
MALPKGTIEFIRFKRARERIVDGDQDIGRQSVEVPAVPAIEPEAATSEGECAVAYRADPILRLPIPTSLDGNACVEGVVDGVAKQLMCGGRQLVPLFDSHSEQHSELGTTRAKVGRSRERQISSRPCGSRNTR